MKSLAIAALVAVSAAASARAAAVSAPMSAEAFAGVKSFLASPAGAGVIADNPALKGVLTMDLGSASLQALGPLAAGLAGKPLDGATFSQAYKAAQGQALAEVGVRARWAAKRAAHDPLFFEELESEAEALGAYALYGPAVRSRAEVLAAKMRGATTQQKAVDLARELLSDMRESAEGVEAAPADPNSPARRQAQLGKPSGLKAGDVVKLKDEYATEDLAAKMRVFFSGGKIVIVEIRAQPKMGFRASGDEADEPLVVLRNDRGQRVVVESSLIKAVPSGQQSLFSEGSAAAPVKREAKAKRAKPSK